MSKETTTKAITKAELINIIKGLDKPTFANIVTETTVKMNKNLAINGTKLPNPFHDLIKKHSKANIFLGGEYQKRVNTNLEKEGKENDFKASENKVGQHISKCLLFNENTNKYYLQYEYFENQIPFVKYKLNDSPISKEIFQSFLLPTKDSYQNQDLENTVKVLSVTVDNILEMTLDKVHYIVEN